jgi:hypothetical protein
MRESDITSLLHIGEVDEATLERVLLDYFRGAQQEGDRTVCYKRGEGDTAITLVYNADGRLYQALAHDALTPDNRESLREIVEQGLLTPGSPSVGRAIFMSSQRVDGCWRYQDLLQILPAPPHAPTPGPEPGGSGPRYPCVVEFVYESSTIPAAASVRRGSTLGEHALLLGFLTGGFLCVPSGRVQFHWVWRSDTEGEHFEYLQSGYGIGEFETEAVGLTDDPDCPVMGTMPWREYLRRQGVTWETPLRMPDRAAELLDKFRGLDQDTAAKFLRACYWLSLSPLQWHTSATASYVSLIVAMEALLPNPGGERCSACGKPTQSTSQAFYDLVETYAPVGDVTPFPARRFYGLRSAIAHGGRLFVRDRQAFMLGPGGWNEFNLFLAASNCVEEVLANWLLTR